MSYDEWVIPPEYSYNEFNINNLIEKIEDDFIYLPGYVSLFSQYLTDQSDLYKKIHKQIPSKGLGEYFPNALNYSFIILAFLILENNLRMIMSIVYEKQTIRDHKPEEFKYFLHNKYRGGNFDKYLQYYSSVTNTPRTKLPNWSQIEKLWKLRDCITHVSGYIAESRDQTEIERFIKARDYLSESDRAKPKPIYPSSNYYEVGELEIDPYDDGRLVVGGFYCKQICHYLNNFLFYVLQDSGIAIYAAY